MYQSNFYGIKKDVGCIPLGERELTTRNENGWDIYWSPNNFTSYGKRKKEDLTQITTFFCEIDSDNKRDQIKKILAGIMPSSVVETKRGFHIYWYLKDFIDCTAEPVAKADWFRSFVVERICPIYGADTQAADASRILRAAFFRYWKDGKGEFISDIAFTSDKKYTLEEMERAFPVRAKPRVFLESPRPVVTRQANNFWEAANRIDALSGLQTLSGTAAVNMDRLEFKKEGRLIRIFCNGKKSNAWIDERGLIGSMEGGGPAIGNWLFWYHRDWKKVAAILKEYFKEVLNVQ